MKKIISQIDRIQHQQIPVELHWILAHQNLRGNEAADRAAKSATGWRQKHKINGRTIEIDTGITATKAVNVPIQKAPVHTTLARLAASGWATSWSQDDHGKELRNIALQPSRTILKLHTKLSKGLSSLLVQMRTGKIGLRKYLHNRKVPDVDNPTCQCGMAPQSVAHVLIHCREFHQLRRETWKEEEKNHAWRSIPIREMLGNPRYAKKAAIFMKKTGLLGQFKALSTGPDNNNVSDVI